MNMAAGELNRSIMVQRLVGTTNAVNQVVRTWEDVKPLRVKIVGSTGMSVVRAGQEGVEAVPTRYSFRARYQGMGVVTQDMRVVFEGVIFSIKDVRHDLDRRQWTDLVCETGGASG